MLARVVTRSMPIAKVAGACARTFLRATVIPGPPGVAEARAGVAHAMPGTVILTLRNLTILAGEPHHARARAVEAVAVVAVTVVARSQVAVAPVPTVVALAQTARALAVPTASRRTA